MARQSGVKHAESTEVVEPQTISEFWAATALPRRKPGAHKWGVGGVVIVAGSPQFAGAAALCCAGAGRSGAGIISAAIPRSIAPVVVGLVPEVTVVFLPEGESNSAALRAGEAIGERLERSAAMVIGPGLGDDAATAALLGSLFGSSKVRGGIGFGTAVTGQEPSSSEGTIAKATKPVVVDADALNWLSEQEQWWDRVPPGLLVLTPHPGEMARLAHIDIEEVLADPERVAVESATRWRQTVVLKGGRTLIASQNGEIVAAEASPALATAGSGDVLSGSIGALLAQGLAAPDAAALAVFVGSRAADQLAARLGVLGVVAGDLPVAIAEQLRVLEELGD